MTSPSPFFIERSVFKKLTDNIKIRGNIIWVEGERRVGKSTACQRVLESLNITFLRIYLTDNVQTTIEMYVEAKSKTQAYSFLPQIINNAIQYVCSKKVRNMVSLCNDIFEVLASGTVVLIEEIQYLSSDQQVVFQQMIDRMQFESVNGRWNGGSLILMGSIPFLVEEMLYGRNSPLYERVLSRVRVHQLDSREIMSAFKQLKLHDNPSMMLSVHSIFGGLVGLYQIFSKKGFDASTSIEEIYKQVFASDMQNNQTQDYFTLQFGSKFTSILDAALNHSVLKNQKNAVAEKLSIDKDMAFQELERLCDKYGLLDRKYSTKKKNSIYSYKLVHPSMLTYWHLKKRSNMRREGVTRDLDPSFSQDLLQIEGVHLERWIKCIIQDRYLLLQSPLILPHGDFADFGRPSIARDCAWDCVDFQCEIDGLIWFPKRMVLLVCSVKRSINSTNHSNLLGHWNALKKHPQNLINITTDNIEQYDTWYCHFSVESPVGVENENGFYHFGLLDLLNDFL